MDELSDGEELRAPVDETKPADHPGSDRENVTSYDDGETFVVCDRKNTRAWIRSDTVADLDV